jgi:membrane dipeptidase
MGRNTRYDGYRAFQYLEPDLDYRSFNLVDEPFRVAPYWVPLSGGEEEGAEGLLEDSVVISLHEHLGLMPEDIEKEFIPYQNEGREFLGYEGLSVSYLDAVFDDMMNGTAFITSKEGWKWDDVIYDLGLRLSDIAH